MRPRTTVLRLALVGLTVLLGGCVRSESSRYTNKLSSVVESKSAKDGEVADAFGLARDGSANTAVAGVSTDQ